MSDDEYILDGDDIDQLMEMLEIEESLPMTIQRYNRDRAVDMDLRQVELLHGESVMLGGCARFLRRMLDKASQQEGDDDFLIEVDLE